MAGSSFSKPSAITLWQIYQLIRPGAMFALHSKKPNPRCSVGRRGQQALLAHYRKADAAIEHELAQPTIADGLHDVLAAGKWPFIFRSIRNCCTQK